jgi:hypothetical protein
MDVANHHLDFQKPDSRPLCGVDQQPPSIIAKFTFEGLLSPLVLNQTWYRLSTT